MGVVDLNADLGERTDAAGVADDQALLDVVTSANVACGGHAGDVESMTRVCALAAARGVAVGAQVSYEDREGFGRRRLDVDPAALARQLEEQILRLDEIARAQGTAVTYVKPHGALYHAAWHDRAHAAAVVGAADAVTRASGEAVALLGPPGSVVLSLAGAAGLASFSEGFADRGYLPDGGLVPRGAPGALLTVPDEVAAHAVRLALAHEVVAEGGAVLTLVVRSLCVHSDTPGAPVLARAVRDALRRAGAALGPFAPPPTPG